MTGITRPRRWLARLRPNSLAGQIMLAAAAALLVAQAINLTLLLLAQREQQLATLSAGAAAQLVEARDRLDQGLPLYGSRGRDRAERGGRGDRFATRRGERRFGRNRRVVLAARPAFRPGMQDWPVLARRVAAALTDADGGASFRAVRAAKADMTASAAVAVVAPVSDTAAPERTRRPQRMPQRLVAVAAQLPDGRWLTVRARLPGPQARIGAILVGQTLVLFALLLVPLALLARRIARPLAQLSRAANDLRPGAPARPVAASGPDDVRALITAFNAMHGRIVTMLTDKDRMLGAIGHDLRTPLASLRVRVESVADTALRDKMIASIEDMALMLGDILSLARAGQPAERAGPVALDALLHDLAQDYAAQGKPVAIAGMLPPVVCTLRRTAMTRAIANLIDNALAYGATARMTLTRDDTAITLAIDDDGPGIPAEQIAAMMEPFARGEASRNRGTGGSGLGLALARTSIQAEGGTLTLMNRAEGGLSARVVLPMTAAAQVVD